MTDFHTPALQTRKTAHRGWGGGVGGRGRHAYTRDTRAARSMIARTFASSSFFLSLSITRSSSSPVRRPFVRDVSYTERSRTRRPSVGLHKRRGVARCLRDVQDTHGETREVWRAKAFVSLRVEGLLRCGTIQELLLPLSARLCRRS